MKRLPVRNYVNNYGSSPEAEVLEAVRKYPTYSVDKLHRILPEIKRHKIQRVLEKKGLSKLEERLRFSRSGPAKIGKYLKKGKEKPFRQVLKIKQLSLPKISLESKKKLQKSGAIIALLTLVLFGVGILARSLVFAKVPIITVQQPEQGALVQNERVFVSGQVEPAQSSVAVNGEQVALNGDGGFTAYVEINVGEIVLDIQAAHWFKKARLLRVIGRELSLEELKAKEEEEKRRDELAQLEQGANDVLAARRTRNEKDPVRVIKSSVVEEEKLTRVEGEVFNFGDTDISFIQVTATFLDEKGRVMDTKSGLVEGFGEVLAPGQMASFETQPTSKEFYAHELTLEWEESVEESEPEGSSLLEEEPN